MYLHVHSLQVAKFKAPLFQLLAFLCPIRNSPVRLSCRVGLMSGTANEGHLGVASSLAYIYIYINEIYNYTIISMCMYVYIYIYLYIYQENRSAGTLFASSEQCCWTDHT